MKAGIHHFEVVEEKICVPCNIQQDVCVNIPSRVHCPMKSLLSAGDE